MTASGTVLTLMAHPDDAEIRCGGALIRLARAGWRVHIATLSTGDCGSMEEKPIVIAARRRAEAQAAAARLGGTYHCLGGQDLQVYDDQAMRSAAVALLREIKPNLVITHYPVDYMPDHDAASAVARMATFTATIPNYVVGPASALPALPAIPPLYYVGPLGSVDYFGKPVHPEFCVDISEVIDEKAAMLACHASQRDWLRKQHGIDQYIEDMKQADAKLGVTVGMRYAEGFFQHRGHAYPQTQILQTALGARS